MVSLNDDHTVVQELDFTINWEVGLEVLDYQLLDVGTWILSNCHKWTESGDDDSVSSFLF
jgi:hypothetical protein